MENHGLVSIYIGGLLSLLMAVYHTLFYRLFGWDREFVRITIVNHKILYTIHTALTILLFSISALTLFYASELSICTGISAVLLVMISLFWLWRTVWQVIYFKPNRRNRRIFMHYALTVHLALLFISYFIPVVLKVVSVLKG